MTGSSNSRAPFAIAGETISKDTYDLDLMTDTKRMKKIMTNTGNRFGYSPEKIRGYTS